MRGKRGVTAHQRHKKVKKATKGMQHARRASVKLGKQAVTKSLQYSYRDRRNKKRDFRGLWIIRINAAARENGISYSKLISALKEAKIDLNRKVLAKIAMDDPVAFSKLVESIKK